VNMKQMYFLGDFCFPVVKLIKLIVFTSIIFLYLQPEITLLDPDIF